MLLILFSFVATAAAAAPQIGLHEGIDLGFLGSCDPALGDTDPLFLAAAGNIGNLNAIVSTGSLLQNVAVEDVNASLGVGGALFQRLSITDNQEEVIFSPSLNNIFLSVGDDDSISLLKSSSGIPDTLYKFPGSNYSYVLTSTRSIARVRLIVLDTATLIHECRGGCQNQSALCPGQSNGPVNTTRCDSAMVNVRADRVLWLQSELDTAAIFKETVIVVGNHPVVSVAANSTDFLELRRDLAPLLDKYKVTAYVFGYDPITQVLRSAAGVYHYGIADCGAMQLDKINTTRSLYGYDLIYNTSSTNGTSRATIGHLSVKNRDTVMRLVATSNENGYFPHTTTLGTSLDDTPIVESADTYEAPLLTMTSIILVGVVLIIGVAVYASQKVRSTYNALPER